MKFLTNIDLVKNQLMNAALHNLGTEPDILSSVKGQLYYNTNSNLPFYFNGTSWINLYAMTPQDILAALLTVDGTASGLDSDLLDGQHGSYYLDWNNAANKPDPKITVTLNGDISGTGNVTLTDLADGNITIPTTIAPDSVALGTDTTGNYVASVSAGTSGAQTGSSGLTINGSGEGAAVTIAHADTSSVTNISSDNSANTVIQDIIFSFDAYGHVTAASVGTVTIHSQNTDTGTTSHTFALDSNATNGVLFLNSNGELVLRNLANTAYANLRVKDLYVEGTQTIINSNIVNIGDNEIELNSDITTRAENSNGGLTLKRLAADNTTRIDAKLTYNESTDRWQTTQGDIDGTITTLVVPNKVPVIIGDGSSTSFVITHNLNSRDLKVEIRETADDYEFVMADVRYTSLNTITVGFAKAPTANQYTITIIG